MGKQWLLNMVTGDSTTTKSAGKSRKSKNCHKLNNTTSSSSSSSSFGCMNAIFHMFDIQNHHLPFNQTSFVNIPTLQENNNLKGVEAPRNSLELNEQQQQPMVEEFASSSSSSTSSKKETNNFNIPMGGIQIKTKRTRLMEQDTNNVSSSECSSNSPAGSKTPSLVARLMGLDILPENSSPRASLSSPRPSSSSSHATPLNPLSKLSSLKNNARSLPGTPRVSTAARPSTEVDYHHRLSLQNGKENKRRYDENTSEYAKQIAKQVRENISRRVGADISNYEKKKELRRDELLVVLKPKKQSPPLSASSVDKSSNLDQGNERGKENEPFQLSSSPRLRLLEIKNNFTKTISHSPKPTPLSSSTEVIIKPPSSSTTKSLPLVKEQVQMVKHENPLTKVQKCKKIASEKYDLKLKKSHQQEDQFKKKCNKKSTPLSKHLVNVNTTTTKFISFKKDISSHPTSTTTTTTLPQTQVPCITHLPNCQNRTYNTKITNNLSVIDNVITNPKVVSTITSSFSDHFEYISKILSQSGIQKNTQISITHWYSPSHPIHPSIFQHIEKHYHPTTTTNVANRKLVFDVTDELLVQILKPYISFKPWVMCQPNTQRMFGSELIEKLSEKLQSFPNKDCKVLEDIDELIEHDMSSITRLVGQLSFEEEAEVLVAELERDMVDTLVGEVAGIIWHVGR